MSAPEPKCTPEQKVRVSIMLKVPIDLDLELLVTPPTDKIPVKHKELSLQSDRTTGVKISQETQANLNENIQDLSTQIIDQLLQDWQAFFPPQTQHQQDNLVNKAELRHDSQKGALKRNYKPTVEQKRKGRVLDTFNDGFTLAVNTVGAVLFLGKLANYTWE